MCIVIAVACCLVIVECSKPLCNLPPAVWTVFHLRRAILTKSVLRKWKCHFDKILNAWESECGTLMICDSRAFLTWQQEMWPQGWKNISTSLFMQTCIAPLEVHFVRLFDWPRSVQLFFNIHILYFVFEHKPSTASCSSLPVFVLLTLSTSAFHWQAEPAYLTI